MPHYHFHLVHGPRKILDTVGCECDNLAAAKKAAEMTARNRIVEQLLDDIPHPNGRHFEITDDKDRPLAKVHFGDLLPPDMKG